MKGNSRFGYASLKSLSVTEKNYYTKAKIHT